MKYSKEERLEIGRQIYTGLLTQNQAAEKYEIDPYTARSYMRFYKEINNLPARSDGRDELDAINRKKTIDYKDYDSLSREELIDEIIKAKVEAERAKKGYIVKGGGQGKEFITLEDANLK